MRSTATAAERNRRRKGAPLRNARPTTARTTTPWRRFCCTSPPPAMPSLRGWTWTRSVRPRRLSRRPSRASSLPPLFFLLQGAIIRQSSAPAHARAFVRPGDPNERRRDRCTVAQSRGSFGIQARALLRTANPSSRRGEGRKCTPLFRFVGGLRRCRRAATGFPVTFFGESVSPSLDPRDHLLTFPPTPLRSQ